MFDDLTDPSITIPTARLVCQLGRLSLWVRWEGGERVAVLLEGEQLRGLWRLPRQGRPKPN